jgi:hypothetical protein
MLTWYFTSPSSACRMSAERRRANAVAGSPCRLACHTAAPETPESRAAEGRCVARRSPLEAGGGAAVGGAAKRPARCRTGPATTHRNPRRTLFPPASRGPRHRVDAALQGSCLPAAMFLRCTFSALRCPSPRSRSGDAGRRNARRTPWIHRMVAVPRPGRYRTPIAGRRVRPTVGVSPPSGSGWSSTRSPTAANPPDRTGCHHDPRARPGTRGRAGRRLRAALGHRDRVR